jgi:hypothetical protein|tara:strand:- start:960 stop:1289 length:330 start_codon:yes stop_codon:yes gene_type:complete
METTADKINMSDSKITKSKSGRVSLAFYQCSECTDNELDLLLSLLGAYNSHGRKFNIDKFLELDEQFKNLLEKADDILNETVEANAIINADYDREMLEEEFLQRSGNIY